MGPARAGEELDGRARSEGVRTALHAAGAVRRYGLSLEWHERGLPVPERLDAGEIRPRAATGAGVFLRRWIPGRRRLGAAIRRREHGDERYRVADRELPPGRFRLHGASGADEGVAPPCFRKL